MGRDQPLLNPKRRRASLAAALHKERCGIGKIGFCPNGLLAWCDQTICMVLRQFQAGLPIPTQWKDRLNQAWLRPTAPRPTKKPTRMISVIIPAHNEQDYLPGTLDALRRQNYPWLEV